MNVEKQEKPITRKTIHHVGDSDRPQKRQKPGTAVIDIIAVLTETGEAKYKNGDYNGAEACFSQALCRIDIDYLCAQVRLKIDNNANDMKSISGTTMTSRTSKKISNEKHIERQNSYCIQEHNKTALDMSDIEYDEGIRKYSQVFAVQESIPADEATVILLYNIAQTYIQRRLYKSAVSWLNKCVDKLAMISTSNKNALSTVMTLHNLGYCLYRTGRESQAKEFYQRALEIVSELNLGPIHLAASVNCMGVLIFNQQPSCSTDLALDMFQKSLELYKSCQDSDLVSIATVLNNIGRVYYLKADFKNSLTIYEECLKLRQKVLGNDSVDVAATAYNLGQTYHQLGRLDDSLSHYHLFLKIMTIVAGPASKDVALVYKGVAEIHIERSDIKMALHYFDRALQAYKANSDGRPTTDIAAILNKMGNLCYEIKDYATAMAHYQEGLATETSILEPNHPHIIITSTNIGHIHKQLGEHKKALSMYIIVRDMQLEKFGEDNFMLAETMSSIGLMQYHLKDYESSFDSYQQALRIRRQHLGGDDFPEIASTLNSIGLVLFKQDIFDLAKNCFTESLRIRSKLLGKDHRDVAILWYNIATIHFETGEDDLAIQMYKETLRVERHALGKDHPDVVLTLQHLGQVHQQLGHAEKALEYFNEALGIERKRKEAVGVRQQRSLARVLNLLGNVYLQLGRTDEMMECYVEASRIYESNRSLGETLVIGGYNFYGLSKTNPPCAPGA